MDYRTDSFVRRFSGAKLHLNARDVQDVVSLKYRQNVHDSDYVHLVDDLKQNATLSVQPIDGFGGRAWLVIDKTQQRVVLVEHETGLEILGALGSVASLIALVPMISSGWARLRHRFFGPRYDRLDENIEVRQIDRKGSLVEHQVPSVEVYVLNTALRENSLLTQRIRQLERELKRLKPQGLLKGKKQTASPKGKKLKKKKKK